MINNSSEKVKRASNVRLFNAAKTAANEYRERVRSAGFSPPSLQDAANDLVIAGAQASLTKPSVSEGAAAHVGQGGEA
jgi:hypothetical protein